MIGNSNLPHINPVEMFGFIFVGQHNNLEKKATAKD